MNYFKKSAVFYLIIMFLVNQNLYSQLGFDWNKTFIGDDVLESVDLKQTNDNGYIILANAKTRSDMAYYPKDILLLKVDSEGNKTWENKINSGHTDYASGLEVLKNGGYAIFGTFDANDTYNDLGWLIITNSFGDTIWTKKYVTHGHAIFEKADKGFILIGEKIQNYQSSVWIAKTDSLGEINWESEFESPISDSLIMSAVVSKEGGESYTILVRGKNGWGGTYIIQVDEYGNKTWDKYYENMYGADMVSATSEAHIDSGIVIIGHDYNVGPHTSYFRLGFDGQLFYSKHHFLYKQHEWYFGSGKSIVRTVDGGYLMTGFVNHSGSMPMPLIGKVGIECDSVEYKALFDMNTFGYGNKIILTSDGGALVTGKLGDDIFLSKLSTKPNAIVLADSNWLDNDWDGFANGMLDGSTSYNFNGYKISNFEWTFNGVVVGTDSTLEIDLPTGDNIIQLKITDDNGITNSTEQLVKVCSYKYTTGGSIYSSISTIDDSLFFASSVDDLVYCFSNSDQVNWTLATGGEIQSTTTIGPNNNIYVGSNDTRLYCFDPLGNFKWDTPMGGVVTASPAIAQDLAIYVGTGNNRLYSVNGQDGSINWNYLTGGEITSSAAVSTSGNIYFGSYDNKFYCLDKEGNLQWSINTNDEINSSPAIDTAGRVYFGSNDGKLYAASAEGIPEWSFTTGGAVQSSPVIDSEGNVYFGSADGFFYCLDVNGIEKWKYNTEVPANGNPALSREGNVIFGCDDGKIISLSKEGNINWSYKTDNSVLASPLITIEGRIYVGSSDRSIYGFTNANNGQNIYSHQWPTFQRDNKRTGSLYDIDTEVKHENVINIPVDYNLSQNYPNPFNPSTKIQFELPETSLLELTIYNITGEKIRTLSNEIKNSGYYSIEWNGLNDHSEQVGSGIYIFQMRAIGDKNNYAKSIKMIKLK